MHGDAIGLESYFTDAELWHLHLSLFLAHKQCVVKTEEAFVIETEQMSSVETRQWRPNSLLAAPAAWPPSLVGHVSTVDICVCRQCLG